MTIEDVLKKVREYNPTEVENVRKAYEIAGKAHANQFRESGEPYIIHPLNVCMNLTVFHADGPSLCAGLLHDVVEDTSYTLEDIENIFGSEVAFLVDGVTKISNMHFNTKDEATNANIRRLINSLNKDVRIIIIKLCDCWHNMKTLNFKAPEKQKRSADETIRIFVPLAYFIGAFRLKCELEDICFSYLEPDTYEALKEKQKEILNDYKKTLELSQQDIKKIFDENNIAYTSRAKVMNIYQIFKKINKGYRLSDIHDLVNIKIIVDEEQTCYQVLGLIHKLYTPLNNKFKDYIACPKTNMYRSLHTTVFGPDNHLLQFQIKTSKMDKINTFGLAAYWYELEGDGTEKMQTELNLNYQFFNTLRSLDDVTESDADFLDRVKREIFTNNIYVYTLRGDILELPNGATVIDFAYKIHTDLGNHLHKVYINGKESPITETLNNKDRILVLTDEQAHPDESWLEHVVTSQARRQITKYLNNN